jgi:hypothetical protein
LLVIIILGLQTGASQTSKVSRRKVKGTPGRTYQENKKAQLTMKRQGKSLLNSIPI